MYVPCQEKAEYFEKENNARLWDQEIRALLFETITKLRTPPLENYWLRHWSGAQYCPCSTQPSYQFWSSREFGSGLIGLPVRMILEIYSVSINRPGDLDLDGIKKSVHYYSRQLLSYAPPLENSWLRHCVEHS